jgi:hypothetical protein
LVSRMLQKCWYSYLHVRGKQNHELTIPATLTFIRETEVSMQNIHKVTTIQGYAKCCLLTDTLNKWISVITQRNVGSPDKQAVGTLRKTLACVETVRCSYDGRGPLARLVCQSATNRKYDAWKRRKTG